MILSGKCDINNKKENDLAKNTESKRTVGCFNPTVARGYKPELKLKNLKLKFTLPCPNFCTLTNKNCFKIDSKKTTIRYCIENKVDCFNNKQFNLVKFQRKMSTDKIKKSKVYTRTGDKGTSSLFNGSRLPKNSDYFDCLGNNDELNGNLGLAREHCIASNNGLADLIQEVQTLLFDIGSHIATPLTTSEENKVERMKFSEEHVKTLEKWIDKLDSQLPPLKNFILPGGGMSAAQLHVCRSVCRRTERSLIPLVERQDVNPTVGRFINRLSDFLFVAARYASHKEGKEDIVWTKPKNPEPPSHL